MARMTRNWLAKRYRGHGGFTLVELAVAMFVVATGLLAVFALLRRGQAAEAVLEEDLRGGLFAETAFATLRAASDQAATEGGWEDFWTLFNAGETNLPLPGVASGALPEDEAKASSFADAPDEAFLVAGGTRAYSFMGWPDDTASFCVSNTVWYELLTSGITNVSATLHVWPERPGGTSQTFFTVFGMQDGRRHLLPHSPDRESESGADAFVHEP